MIDIDEIRPWLIFECVSGSKAYGTDTPESDLDLKGVFVLPPERFFGLETVEQVKSMMRPRGWSGSRKRAAHAQIFLSLEGGD